MEKIRTDALEWYVDRMGVVGGMAAWGGGILLQWLHLALMTRTSLVGAGQKMEDSALEIMDEVP